MILDLNNQGRIEPSVFSRVEIDTRVQQRLQAFRDVIHLSYMEGGPVGQIGVYIDPVDIQTTFDPENLHIQGVELTNYMKAPTYDARMPGAYRMYIGRVGHATPATLMLKDDDDADVLQIDFMDNGTYVNKTSVEVMHGSLTGKRVIVRFSTYETVTYDNLGNGMDVSYIGNATAALMTITRTGDQATRLQVAIDGATDGSIDLDIDLLQPEYGTIADLSQFINAQLGYRASINRFADPLSRVRPWIRWSMPTSSMWRPSPSATTGPAQQRR